MATAFAVHSSKGLVRMSGELDLTSRGQAFDACCNCTGFAIVVDLSALTFMDSRGYAAIVDASRALESEGRTLTFSGMRGQPLRLVALISMEDDMELQPPSPAPIVSSTACVKPRYPLDTVTSVAG